MCAKLTSRLLEEPLAVKSNPLGELAEMSSAEEVGITADIDGALALVMKAALEMMMRAAKVRMRMTNMVIC